MPRKKNESVVAAGDSVAAGRDLRLRNRLRLRRAKLRFPEFDGEWEEKKLGDVLLFKNGLNASKEKYGKGEKYISVLDIINNQYINYENIIGRVEVTEKEFESNKVSYGDILFQRSSETREEVGQANVYLDSTRHAVFGGFVIRGKKIQDYQPMFMNFLLKTTAARKDITTRSGGSTRYNIGQESLEAVQIHLPSLPEQTKIAAFLSAVDKKIEQLSRKKAWLEKYKKGAMQKIFSREIRFRPPFDTRDALLRDRANQRGVNIPSVDTGRTLSDRSKIDCIEGYPDWEEKRLGDVASEIAYGMNSAAIEYDGKNKYIRITDIDENSRKFTPNPLTSPEGQLDEKYLLKEGDICFARTGASVGKSYLYDVNDGRVFFAGFLIKFSIKSANPYFIFQQTLTKTFQQWVIENSMRSGQPGVNAEEFKSFKIPIPSLPEQTKIAAFLSSLDSKISSVSAQLAAAQKFKKGLLQQMFV